MKGIFYIMGVVCSCVPWLCCAGLYILLMKLTFHNLLFFPFLFLKFWYSGSDRASCRIGSLPVGRCSRTHKVSFYCSRLWWEQVPLSLSALLSSIWCMYSISLLFVLARAWCSFLLSKTCINCISKKLAHFFNAKRTLQYLQNNLGIDEQI